MLQDLLGRAETQPFRQLLVGTETGDDAAVWQVDDRTCIVATTDFFTPVVDDPFDFGRIAATNAISDVYAMGGTPVMALAILGVPIDKVAPDTVRRILEGGRHVCAAAGIPVAGGHSIDSAEPIYGLAVIGTCRPEDVRRNSGARPGDALILTKALGVGIYSAAFRKEMLPPDGYAELVATTTLLNRVGTDLARNADVHAITDVTGFGLLGHALEMARGSAARVVVEAGAVPRLRLADELIARGHVTGASGRNWASYGAEVDGAGVLPAGTRELLTDPQTSGGLLVACAPERADEVAAAITASGYPASRRIGRVEAGPPRVLVA